MIRDGAVSGEARRGDDGSAGGRLPAPSVLRSFCPKCLSFHVGYDLNFCSRCGTALEHGGGDLVDRCTCDLARPYWHSFHREGCELAR